MAIRDFVCQKCGSMLVYVCYRGIHCDVCDFCTGDPMPMVGPDSPVHPFYPGEWPYEGLTDPHVD